MVEEERCRMDLHVTECIDSDGDMMDVRSVVVVLKLGDDNWKDNKDT